MVALMLRAPLLAIGRGKRDRAGTGSWTKWYWVVRPRIHRHGEDAKGESHRRRSQRDGECGVISAGQRSHATGWAKSRFGASCAL